MKMSPEYMAELHKFLYLSNDSDEERLRTNVTTHLKYIPHKKLYRYRKCNDRELGMLRENAIWISNPENFPDLFDATIPINKKYIDFEYSLYFGFETAYEALKRTAEEGEKIPDKETFFADMFETMEKYSLEELEERMIEIFGQEEYERMRSRKFPNIDFSGPIDRTKEFLSRLSSSPRDTLAITSFTTRYDNRNMWENYAENYTGFCVEYCFSDIIETLSSKSAWDVLHLLPVKYFRKPLVRPTYRIG